MLVVSVRVSSARGEVAGVTGLPKRLGKQIPRGLKSARDDKSKELIGTAEAVAFQNTAQPRRPDNGVVVM